MNYPFLKQQITLMAIVLIGVCGGCMKNKQKIARELIGEKVIIILVKQPDLQSNILDIQDYIRDGESYIPFFSSKEAFQESIRGVDLGKPIIAIDRRLFFGARKDEDILILNVGLSTETKFTGEELKRIFPEPFTLEK